MTQNLRPFEAMTAVGSQSAFVRGFIDDVGREEADKAAEEVSIRVRARLHR